MCVCARGRDRQVARERRVCESEVQVRTRHERAEARECEMRQGLSKPNMHEQDGGMTSADMYLAGQVNVGYLCYAF